MATSDATGGVAMGPGKGRRYSVQVLLGKRDDPLLSLYARQLLEQMKCDAAVSVDRLSGHAHVFPRSINVDSSDALRLKVASVKLHPFGAP